MGGGGMTGRTIVFGGIHGCLNALTNLIDALALGPEDTVVTLGDYIGRGPDSCGVLDQLIAISEHCRLIPLLGDHEEMLINALGDITALRRWLACGGSATLRSHGWLPGGPRRALADWIPEKHQAFLVGCRPYYETGSHLFIHAGFVPELPMDK